KDGKLEAGEIEAMNLHPKYGSEILSHIKQLKDVIPGMRGHHEKYDGTGYPDGLKDNEIPLAARIIAVADTFDAMTTDRPYRKARTADDAVDELKKHAGRQFDPLVVDAFLKAWREMEFVL
ncbi:MAG: HD domain-containing protein, partial [Nitrospirae bacterium]|nr:HD domain-containing protein [Nitrospirota bacterium]